MRIAICDNLKSERQKAIEALNSVIKNFSVNEFDNGSELLESHALHPYDLIILDILMPKINGIDTAVSLRKNDTKTPIIFMSTSEEFGVQSYRVLAFDYLLKPIDKDQLKACMKRLLSQREKKKQYITVTYSGVETNILLSNIQCLESNLRKVIFTLSENREIKIIGKLTDFEQFLLKHGFCRCHKSYLVNIEHIDRIDDNMFYLTGGKTIKISRTYLQSAKKAYFDYIFTAEV
ncbi:MAG: response regulator transcription factor [Lachnospiraceae bacterium]|nr:response regulator transcription factor [Lachnospiraceae bacterium]